VRPPTVAADAPAGTGWNVAHAARCSVKLLDDDGASRFGVRLGLNRCAAFNPLVGDSGVAAVQRPVMMPAVAANSDDGPKRGRKAAFSTFSTSAIVPDQTSQHPTARGKKRCERDEKVPPTALAGST
jgi:hypothetical protein